MRKFGLILLGLLIGLPSFQAQENFRIGAKGGVNLFLLGRLAKNL